MKLFRVFLFAASLILLLVSCRDGAVLNGPVGNYLYIAIDVPDTEDGQSLSRVIHPDSAKIDISLTYQSGQVIEGFATLDSSSDVAHTLEQLPVGLDVVVEVTLGVDGIDLCSSSVTMDINPGGNSTDIVLAYSEYTVQGTLVDTNGLPVAGQIVEVDGVNVTTDADGKFSFTVTTEDWDGYTKFYMNYPIEGELEFARNKKTLIENRSSFSLTAQPELFVDLTIQSDNFPLKGAYVMVFNGEWTEPLPVAASSTDRIFSDSSGRFKYGPVLWGGPTSPVAVRVGFKGVFAEYRFNTLGAPGAIVGDVTLEPNIFVTTEDPSDSTEKLLRLNYGNTANKNVSGDIITGYDNFSLLDGVPEDLAGLLGNGLLGGDPECTYLSGSSYGAKVFCDYSTGQLYFIASYYVSPDFKHSIFKMNGWDTSYGDIDGMGTITYKEIPIDIFDIDPMYQYNYSVQQMVMLSDGLKILAVTSNGAFTFNTETLVVDKVWGTENLASAVFTLNGGYESEDGTLYVLGSNINNPGDGVLSIWRLNNDGSFTSVEALPTDYNTFPLSAGNMYSEDFATLIGLYPWSDRIISVLTQNSSYSESGGAILSMDAWNVVGSPSKSASYNYLIPVGILPNNKFYLINETNDSLGEKQILRMNGLDDTTLEAKKFFTNSSGGYKQMYYYFQNPFSGV